MVSILYCQFRHLPKRLPGIFVFQNGDRFDFTTVLKLFFDFLFVRCKMHIAHKDAATVAIIFRVGSRIRHNGLILLQLQRVLVAGLQIIFLLQKHK